MVNKRKPQKRTPAASIAIGAAAAILLSVLLVGGGALLISKGTVKEELASYIAMIILFLAGGTGCVISTKMTGEHIATISGITAGVYAVVLFGVAIFVFEGDFAGILSKMLAILLGAIGACLVSARRKKKRPSR